MKAASSSAIEAMLSFIEQRLNEYVQTLISICEIPAPTFEEEERARYFAERFLELGLDAEIDQAGNVVVPVFQNDGPSVVLSAHLDTVFPFRSIRVKQNENLLLAPGISDDSAGLAGILHVTKSILQARLTNKGSLTVVATVGEEGLGNLRGIKHYFDQLAEKPDFFLSLDGANAETLINVGLASKRLRLTYRGPGGHSWGDAGVANPIHLSGELLSKIQRLKLPDVPKTVINVGIIRGGTSINAIPTEISMDIDLRSESAESLTRLDRHLNAIIEEVREIEPTIGSIVEVLGERPAGEMRRDHPYLQMAIDANQRFGLRADLDIGSTDSNIPFARGIAALTTGAGGRSGKIHTPDEWYDFTSAAQGLKRTAFLIAQILQS